MWGKAIVLSCLALLLTVAGAVQAELIGHWRFDEGTGGQVVDATGRGHDGTINGATWSSPGSNDKRTCLLFDGSNDVVVVPHADDLRFGADSAYTIAAWVNMTIQPGHWSGIVTKGRDSSNWYGIWVNDGNLWVFGHQPNNQLGSQVEPGVWVHVVMAYNNGNKRIYLDGVLDSEATASASGDNTSELWFGAAKGVTEFAPARIDDIRIYNHAVTDAEIQKIMKGTADAPIAYDPEPEDGGDDIPRDVVLGWTPGEFAATHDVYLGTVIEDVNSATQPVASVTDAAYDPEGLLEYGQTYYWRVDEVNGAPDYTVFKGEVWSFTVEPYAYPITNVTATASSAQPASPASNTINGSGLNELDQHGTDLKTMWVTPGGLPAWIQYTFDKEYKLHELWVWNANSELETFMGFGARSVTIEYSSDGQTWAQLENVPEFDKGTGLATYTANNIIDLVEVMEKYVKLTVAAGWGATGIVSLSEVRFFYTPVQAFEPDPADGATGVDINATLNWRPGREATSHEVHFGTDPNALTAETVTTHSYTPASMDFGTKYYWKVNEVGNSGTFEGDTWSFTSQECEPIDDFESYNDDIDAGTTIWHAWTDGVTTEASGSQVGYTDPPFAETSIVHSGEQSMPLTYDNATKFSFSEAEREFDPVQDCTGNGATHVCMWTRGYPAIATVDVAETGGRMNLAGAGADIWGNSDEFTYAYRTLAGDGTFVARVVSIGAGSNTWAKGGVMIRDSLNGGSVHAMMVLTANTDGAAGNGASFQYRATTDGGSANADSSSLVAPPYWVRIERIANIFRGSVSSDGKTWTLVGTADIAMTDPVCIGLCVTSHAPGEDRTYQFDGIAGTGEITGAWQGAIIDNPQYNDAANMHLLIEDSAGRNATVASATAVTVADWTRWAIPMSDFAGVNFTRIKRIVITIGDKNATTSGGSGIVFIDDIGFGHPAE
ncbi:MAG: LamG-like jellyroll fold domain-containing protein [Phycisphaerales bacterium]